MEPWQETDEQVRAWAEELGDVRAVPRADQLSVYQTIAVWMRRIGRGLRYFLRPPPTPPAGRWPPAIVGPLVVVGKVADVKYGELVEIETGHGLLRRGTVLDISTERAIVQVFEGTVGLDVERSRVRFLGRSQTLGVSAEIIGRVFENVVYIPYCFEVGGEIIKVYDPMIHQTIAGMTGTETGLGVRRGTIDRRWVPCYRSASWRSGSRAW